MHFFTKKFKFKFVDSAIEQQCMFILQNFTNCSQHEIMKIEVKTINLFYYKYKSEKLKKNKNNQFNVIWYCLKFVIIN